MAGPDNPPGLTSLTPSLARPEYLMPLISLPFFAVRVFTTLRVLRRWKIEDTLLTVAVIFALVSFLMVPFEGFLASKLRGPQIDPQQVVLLYRLFGYISCPAFALSTGLSKLSVLYYLLNFSTGSSLLCGFIRATIIITGLYTVVTFMVSAVCTSFYNDSKSITRSTVHERCSRQQVILICGLLNSLIDVIILILPIPILRPLQTWSLRRVGVFIVLISGGFVVAASVYRLKDMLVYVLSGGENMESWITNVAWSAIELWSSIICACLPFTTAFIRHYTQLRWKNKGRSTNNAGRERPNGNNAPRSRQCRHKSNTMATAVLEGLAHTPATQHGADGDIGLLVLSGRLDGGGGHMHPGTKRGALDRRCFCHSPGVENGHIADYPIYCDIHKAQRLSLGLPGDVEHQAAGGFGVLEETIDSGRIRVGPGHTIVEGV